MRHIAILTDNQKLGQQLVEWTIHFCSQRGMFPMVELYKDSDAFYSALKNTKSSGVIVALSGVAGLNASERLRSLCPHCGLIWCSDLDFSLQAYRLRAEYFIKGPPSNAELCNGLSFLINSKVKKQAIFERI